MKPVLGGTLEGLAQNSVTERLGRLGKHDPLAWNRAEDQVSFHLFDSIDAWNPKNHRAIFASRIHNSLDHLEAHKRPHRVMDNNDLRGTLRPGQSGGNGLLTRRSPGHKAHRFREVFPI